MNRKVLTYLCTALLFVPTVSFGDSTTREQLQNKLKNYIEPAYKNTKGYPNGIPTGDPKWYGGNMMGPVALTKDMLVNLLYKFPMGFLQCFKFRIGSMCYKKLGPFKIPVGFNISFRWPIAIVHSHRDNQNRYIPPPLMMAAVSPPMVRELEFYTAAKNLHVPAITAHAGIHTAVKLDTQTLLPFSQSGPLIPALSSIGIDPDLTEMERRARYNSGKMGDLNHLEYTLGPSLTHAAWSIITDIFPFLKLIPCIPPPQLPVPISSEQPGFIDITRNPFLGFAFFKDRDLLRDLEHWFLNPSACTEWMMNRRRQGIPFDMFDTAKGLTMFLPAPFSPMPDSRLSLFNRMCTNNWGGSIPFTTTHNLSATSYITAALNIEKAIRLGMGIQRTLIDGTPAYPYIGYFPFDKDKDAYQETYPKQTTCRSVGNPDKFKAIAESNITPKEFGLYSFTHWKRIPLDNKCCMPFANIAKFAKGLTKMDQGFSTLRDKLVNGTFTTLGSDILERALPENVLEDISGFSDNLDYLPDSVKDFTGGLK